MYISSSAYLVTLDGESILCEMVSCETVRIPASLDTFSLTGGTTYSTTVKYKTNDKACKTEGINAIAVMTMTWEDVFGCKNVLKSVKGYFSVDSGTYVGGSGVLFWGSKNYLIASDAPNKTSINQEFEKTLNYTSTDDFDGTLWAHAECLIRSPETKKNYQLFVEVCPNYFD